MNILRRARARGEAFVARHLGEAVAFAAEIPGSAGPLAQLRVEAESTPHAGGERVRLRAHFTLRLRPAPALPRAAEPPRPALPARLGRWIERRLAGRMMRIVAAPLIGRDVNTWVELRASSAALDDGSRALVPDKLAVLGIEPDARKPVQTWAGGLGGTKPGYAMLTLLQLDKDRLPPPMRAALGAKPFQMSATLVNVIEDS